MSVIISRVAESTGLISCTSSSSTSQPFGFGNVAGGLVFCIAAADSGGTALATVTVAFHAHYSPNDSASQLADGTNSPVTITMAPGRCYDLPAALFGASQVRICPTTAGQTCSIRFIGKA